MIMIKSDDKQHRSILQKIARNTMIERGLLPDFSTQAMAELDRINGSTKVEGSVRDLRNLLWCSIDNDESLDLDQLTVAIPMPDENLKILVAIANVEAIVKKDSALDEHASHNTTSVYTAAQIFPMLPEKLSTDLTSLNLESERPALIIEMTIGPDGSLKDSDVYQALVLNRAKLAYNSVAAWLEGNRSKPEAINKINGLTENIQLQDQAAKLLKTLRYAQGALDLETIEVRPVFDGEEVKALEIDKGNRAKDIIEDFMVAANGVAARFLETKKYSSIRRVVRKPKRWDRIVDLASEHKFVLPQQPDSKALDQFLLSIKTINPLGFPDLCLSVIKLLGRGEYVLELPGESSEGHFGLAVKDYAHSTAPNRRFPDLVTQRLLIAAMKGQASPYTNDELADLAKHCTEEEDAAKKVERQVGKSVAAILMESRIGEKFDAIITGAADKGTWVRLMNPPIEGKLVEGFKGMDVGQRLKVQLIHTDVEHGFIDFKKSF